ncbi:MAG: HEAT repeat domain-containing protein [Myxococcales bacterium]|nr:HEAT repeat domain-containing protein [Myxococcales bacterium]
MLLLSTLAAVALAAPRPPPEPSPAEQERDALRGELEALEQAHDELTAAHDLAVQDAAAAQAEVEALAYLVERARILLDDRADPEERERAAAELAATGDVRALPFLRAAAGQTTPTVQEAAVRAALGFEDPEGVSPAQVFLEQRDAPKEPRLAIVDALGEHQTPQAAQVLWDVGANDDVQARIRAAAFDELRESYPSELDGFGTPPPIADAFGALTFVTASGLAGGVLLSSFGVWGQFDAGPALGAIGGSAIGLGSGALYAATRPVTAGDGLALASGVSFGLTYGAWTTTAVHGAWRYLDWPDRDDVVQPAAAWRALGVVGGGAIGLFSVSRNPTAWDVLEVDTATYLGSGIALGAVGLLTYRPPEDDGTTFSSFTSFGRPRGISARRQYDREASQRLALAELVGATAGATTGYLLHDRWQLHWQDGAIASVLAAEGAWAGNWTPPLLAIQDADLKGNIRLPLHLFAAGGLVLGELTEPSYGRSLSTAFGAGVGNALGASIPMVAGYDDARSIATWMVPLGLAGTAAGFVVEPMIAPTPGDAAMIGVTTAITGTTGMWLGLALDDQEVWIDSGQGTGLGLLTTGLGGLGAYGLSAALDPRVDDVLVVGSASAFGAGYGALIPLALASDPAASTVLYGTTASELVFAGASVVGVRAGLKPRSVVIPELLGLSGGTLGALVVGLVQDDGQYVAMGALVGGTVGIGVGALGNVVIANNSQPRSLARWRPQRAPIVIPTFRPEVGSSGETVPTVGVDVLGW